MFPTRRLTRSLLIVAAAAVMMAGAPDNEDAIGDVFLRADSKITKTTNAFTRTLPKTITSTVRKLEKADAKGKSVEQLTAIANIANTKLQGKSDIAVVKLFAINDEATASLTELQAQLDYFVALSFVFNESTTQVIQGTQDAIDAINTALANEIAD